MSEVLAAAESLLGVRMTPLAGGYSGETFVVDLGDGDVTGARQAVVRVFARDPSRAAVTVGVLRLLTGLLPVPTTRQPPGSAPRSPRSPSGSPASRSSGPGPYTVSNSESNPGRGAPVRRTASSR